MKHVLLIALLFANILFLKAQDPYKLDSLFAKSKLLNRHFVGFSLYGVGQDTVVYARNEDKAFTPASNTKVFTLYTALQNLGDSIPGLEYIERGDSLIFWGTGDPTFLHNRLDTRKVYDFLKFSTKKLYYVPTESAEDYYRNGWSIEDYDKYYQPEIATFPIYGNVVTFRAPEKNSLKASPPYFDKNLVISDRKYKSFWITRKMNENVFQLSSIYVPKNYVNEIPFHYSDSLFTKLLIDTLKRDVEMIAYEKTPDTRMIYSIDTKSLLREMMLPSDNFLAEQFTMLAAQSRFHAFNTDELRDSLASVYKTILTDTISLHDGSGLSSYNKITPRSMVELLKQLQSQIPNELDLHYLFPAGGLSGTLRSAYPLFNGEPYVWAKTGTLTSVYCQSGYITCKSGNKYIFSFLNNNFLGAASSVRREMVSIMNYIHENY
ncbi:D-alanyl-D-alanine carboxypeptidase/D-alanyl-D-alanine-endopeptidase [Sphingobacterium hungaricum]|uniref:Peptidase S13 n=1 Tax=Sphingobacterium hungaricum TaxID=2082723 RepID=A0A928YRT0_9SPHI|nr:D-alanyl-D-alanine carboxypeptidase [Sphingobacterium hungaricum]MBE8715002.1 peptidase S13 [Sphingobacterium hungaricum]